MYKRQDSDFIKIVDFGIAQFAGPVAHRTRAGIALGSAAYMAPEQAEGKRVDGRADLCLLYTSDAADERSSVDLGGRRIIKKKKRDEESTRDNMRKIMERRQYQL